MFGLTLNYFAVKAGNFEVSADQPEGTIHCDGADFVSISPQSGDSATYTAPVGGIVDLVCVKRGNTHTPYFSDQNPGGCYSVVGIGTNSITVTRTDSDDCKDISHLDIVLRDPEVSPSPEVSPTPEVSPSPEVSPTPEVSPSPEVSPTPEVSPSPEVTPSPTTPPNSCDPEQFCSTSCGRVATDLPNGSCGIKHCDPTAACIDPNPTATPTPEDSPIGGTSGQVLGATTDTYANAGVAEDIAFSLIGLTGTGLSSLGILMRRNEKK
jgi:hypothetical protein